MHVDGSVCASFGCSCLSKIRAGSFQFAEANTEAGRDDVS